MKINPQILKENKFFYNNICIILVVFSALCFFTSFGLEKQATNSVFYRNIKDNGIIGPIKVGKTPVIYRVKASFYGDNWNTYLSGEVLDEDQDTLYEFGKDLWHESGYDSEGYWSEADRNMQADLSFTEPGTYYIQFNTDNRSMNNIGISLTLKKGSGIPHLMMGTISLLITCILFFFTNRKWLVEFAEEANEWLEEHCDD